VLLRVSGGCTSLARRVAARRVDALGD